MQIGQLEEAVEAARQAVVLTTQSKDVTEQYVSHATLGRALHLFGELDDARRKFEEAARLRSEMDQGHHGQPKWRGRFTLQESHYCDLLIEEEMIGAALDILRSTTQTTKETLGLLDYALYRYSQGRAILVQSKDSDGYFDAKDHLDEAIENLKKVMRRDDLGFAYLVRSQLHRLLGNFPSAQKDLDAAREIAERGSINILLADCYLEACRLHLELSQRQGAIRNFDNAKAMVENMRYGRRKNEVEELERILKFR
jgi:tetratricopeptide (TPR) repeat protein